MDVDVVGWGCVDGSQWFKKCRRVHLLVVAHFCVCSSYSEQA